MKIDSRSHQLSKITLFAALMAALGLIPKIDLPFGVPITLQSLGPMLAGCLLGARLGLQSQALFLFAVALGLPLLAGGRGGLAAFMAPTSGYLIGFPLSAFACGLFMQLSRAQTPKWMALYALLACLIGGILIQHTSGVIGLVLLAGLNLKQALLATLAFVPGDLLKCCLTAWVVHAVIKGVPDWRIQR